MWPRPSVTVKGTMETKTSLLARHGSSFPRIHRGSEALPTSLPVMPARRSMPVLRASRLWCLLRLDYHYCCCHLAGVQLHPPSRFCDACATQMHPWHPVGAMLVSAILAVKEILGAAIHPFDSDTFMILESASKPQSSL